MKVSSRFGVVNVSLTLTGTLFTPTTINSTETLSSFLRSSTSNLATISPTSFLPVIQDIFIDVLLDLYPDDPTLGSPYNTGNNTFGLSSQWKRGSAIVGDLSFQALRRAWINAAASQGVTTFGYLFTEPSASTGTNGGVLLIQKHTYNLTSLVEVSHGAEVPYVYGLPTITGSPGAKLSTQMIDYWVSFATGLDPNDGQGSQRKLFNL